MNKKLANVMLVVATAICFYFVMDDSSKRIKNHYQKEYETEKLIVNIQRDTQKGKYGLINTTEFILLMRRSEPLIIDTRDKESFRKGHIKGAQNFPFSTLNKGRLESPLIDEKLTDNLLKTLGNDKKRLIIFHGKDLNDKSSHKGASWTRKKGFTNVMRYCGGIYAFKGSGRKVETSFKKE